MTSASTYLIDATGADPVVVQGAAPPPLYPREPRPEPGYIGIHVQMLRREETVVHLMFVTLT